MTWLKTDDRFPEHRKIRRLTDGAYRLHHAALSYAAKDETDGLIRPDDLDEMQHGRRLAKHVDSLVKAGLWEPVRNGWMLHDFLDYNPSHAQLEAERAANRERQARMRARRRGVTSDDVDGHGVTNGVTNGAVTRESQHPVPTRTVPTRTDPIRSDVDSPSSSTVTHVTRATSLRAVPDSGDVS